MATAYAPSRLDWHGPLCTKDGRPGILLDPDPVQRMSKRPRRRVAICNYNPPKNDSEASNFTVFTFDEEGVSRCDEQPSNMDLVNGAGTFEWRVPR